MNKWKDMTFTQAFNNSHSLHSIPKMSVAYTDMYHFIRQCLVSEVTPVCCILSFSYPNHILITSHIITIHLILVPNI